MQRIDELFASQESKVTKREEVEKVISDAVFLISFYVGKTRFATPIDRVKEIVEEAAVTALPVANEVYSGVLNLRGNLIPILSAVRLLRSDSATSTTDNSSKKGKRFVVFETKDKEPFAIEATQVHKVECPESELRGLSEVFNEVIRIEETPTHLLNFFSPEAVKILAAGEVSL